MKNYLNVTKRKNLDVNVGRDMSPDNEQDKKKNTFLIK